LKRKSDSKPYVGITIKDRFEKRMAGHRISDNFEEDDFTVEILMESSDRELIESMEERYIEEYDSFNNGLNKTKSGKGYGHGSPKFTTLGYKYSDSSRKKMSESGKARAEREGFATRSARSKQGWENGGEELRKRQSEIRKGKRLRKTKLSDDQVSEIRKLYASEYHGLMVEVEIVNKERHNKNPSWKKATPNSIFSKKYCSVYGVSAKLIDNIVMNRSRTEVLPSLCKS
jgi:hypothetical protein